MLIELRGDLSMGPWGLSPPNLFASFLSSLWLCLLGFILKNLMLIHALAERLCTLGTACLTVNCHCVHDTVKDMPTSKRTLGLSGQWNCTCLCLSVTLEERRSNLACAAFLAHDCLLDTMASPSRSTTMENAVFSQALSPEPMTTFESRSGTPSFKEASSVHPHILRAAKPRIVHFLSVVAVVSLALVYSVFRCFQHVSHSPSLGIQLRAMATGGFDEGSCLGWQGGEDSTDDVLGEEEEPQAGTSDASGDAAGRGARGRPKGQEQDEPAKDPVVFAKGWDYWRMPPEWQYQVKISLARWTAAAAQCMQVLPSLHPSQRVSLVKSLSYLAALELSGFAYIPAQIQPVREHAGTAFVRLLESLLSNEATADFVARSRARGNIECLQRLFGNLTGVPESPLLISRASLKASVICHWKVCSYTLQCVEGILSSLAHPDDQLGVSPYEAERAISVVRAIFATRKRQVLRRALTKAWLVSCQRRIGVFLLFTKHEFLIHSSEPKQRASSMLEEVVQAIEGVGGSPVQFATAQAALPASLPVSGIHSQGPGFEEGVGVSRRRSDCTPRGDLSQQPSAPPPVSESMPHQVPSAVGTEQAQPSTQSSHSPQASYQAAAQQQGITPAPSASETTISGAAAFEMEPELRPRGRGAEGWGIRTMPLMWEANMVHLMNKMNTVAFQFMSLVPSLHPEDAVPLAMYLAKMAAVEVAAFGYVPDCIQSRRAEVGLLYAGLIDRISATGSSTLRAAETLGLQGTLVSLRLLLREVSLEPPRTDVIDAHGYKRKICVQYMVSRYAFQRALDLLNRISQADLEERKLAKQAIKACEGIVDVLRVHLFANSFLRNWFIVCQKRVAPFTLLTREEHRHLGRFRMKRTEEVLFDIEEAIQKAGFRLAPIRFGDDSSSKDSLLDEATEERVSAQLSTAVRVKRPESHTMERHPSMSLPSHEASASAAPVRPQLLLAPSVPPCPRVGEQSVSSLEPSSPFRPSEPQHWYPSSPPSHPSPRREFRRSLSGVQSTQTAAFQQTSHPSGSPSIPPALMVSTAPDFRPSPLPSFPHPYAWLSRSSAVLSGHPPQTVPTLTLAPTASMVPSLHGHGQPPQLPLPLSYQRRTLSSADPAGSPFWGWRSSFSEPRASMVPPPPGFERTSRRSLLSHQTGAPSSAERWSQPSQPASAVSPALPLRLPDVPSIWAVAPEEQFPTESRSLHFSQTSLPSAVRRRALSWQALEETSVGVWPQQYGFEAGAEAPTYEEGYIPEELALPQTSTEFPGISGAVGEAADSGLTGLTTSFGGWSLADLAEDEEDS
ncbi:hypothetical protein Esti_000995 [Eimeria stiedai]